MTSFYDVLSLMKNRAWKNINQILEGKGHCINAIGIEIHTTKLQKNRGGILSNDVVLRDKPGPLD
jgi:hypothetical protein